MHEFTCGRCQDCHDEQAKEIVELKQSQSRLEQNWWDSAVEAKNKGKDLTKLKTAIANLVSHARAKASVLDSTASDGEDPAYYELDATIVDAVINCFESIDD